MQGYLYDEFERGRKRDDELRETTEERDKLQERLQKESATKVLLEKSKRRLTESEERALREVHNADALKKEVKSLQGCIGLLEVEKSELKKHLQQTEADAHTKIADATPGIEKDFLDFVVDKIEQMPKQASKKQILTLLAGLFDDEGEAD